MPRKKATAAEAPTDAITQTRAETPTATTEAQPAQVASIDEAPKNWGPPYKAIFTSSAKGFEMGENRRYRQRVFMFKDKPNDAVIAKLKEHGFTFRPAEKAWTIPADAASRLLTDRFAAEFAGVEFSMSR